MRRYRGFPMRSMSPRHPGGVIRVSGATATFFAVGTSFVQVDKRSGPIFLLQRALSLQTVHSYGGAGRMIKKSCHVSQRTGKMTRARCYALAVLVGVCYLGHTSAFAQYGMSGPGLSSDAGYPISPYQTQAPTAGEPWYGDAD